MPRYRKIQASDDQKIAEIIRANLEKLHPDIPGTTYCDPELDRLSAYYGSGPAKRAYFVALDEAGQVIGRVGFSEFDGITDCAELQKLYLVDSAKGKGYGKDLMCLAEEQARSAGYRNLYLETRTNLAAALGLYEKLGFPPIGKPCSIQHSTMNRFYRKPL